MYCVGFITSAFCRCWSVVNIRKFISKLTFILECHFISDYCKQWVITPNCTLNVKDHQVPLWIPTDLCIGYISALSYRNTSVLWYVPCTVDKSGISIKKGKGAIFKGTESFPPGKVMCFQLIAAKGKCVTQMQNAKELQCHYGNNNSEPRWK